MNTLAVQKGDSSPSALVTVALPQQNNKSLQRAPQVQYGFDRALFREHAKEAWERLATQESLPQVAGLNELLLPMFRAHSVVISLSADVLEARVRFIGIVAAEISGLQNRNAKLAISDTPPGSILAHMPRFISQVRKSLAPVEFNNIRANGSNGETFFNGILLPFDDTETEALHILAIFDSADALSNDASVLDLTSDFFAENPSGTLELQFDQILAGSTAPFSEMPGDAHADELTLTATLGAARRFARDSRDSELRSHAALYMALSKAHDFAILTSSSPNEFSELLAESEICLHARAPMTPIVKLVFGKDFDRTRLAEYSAVLIRGKQLNIPLGGMLEFLRSSRGGIKGIVAEARMLKRGYASGPARKIKAGIARQLRQIEVCALDGIQMGGEEFGVVLVRQMDNGETRICGAVSCDVSMIEKLGKSILAN